MGGCGRRLETNPVPQGQFLQLSSHKGQGNIPSQGLTEQNAAIDFLERAGP